MSETVVSDNENSYSTCRTCLRMNANVRTMCVNELNILQCLLPNILKSETEMTVCIFCSWVFNKIIKFQRQCEYANYTLNIMMKQKMNKLKPECLNHCYNYVSVTHPVQSIKGYDEVPSGDENYHVSDDECKDDMFYDEPVITLKKEADELVIMHEQNEMEDDLPLLILRKDRKKNRNKIERDGSSRKIEKETNSLFSKRMVKETDEYVVIKLSRQEVLDEMSTKAKSDKYVRALYKCDLCVKGFNFEDVLQKHMLKHSVKNGLYKCDICSQYCPSAVSLRGHLKSHTSRYKCKVCGCVKISRQHQLEHYSIAHTPDAIPQYSCEECSFTTDKRTVMQRHVRTHNVTDKHPCHRCGKLFKNLETLRVHTTRHDKTKLLQCDICNKNFLYPSLLQKHVRSVHVLKEYYCVECDVKFKSLDNMRSHFKKAKKHRDPSKLSVQSTELVTVSTRRNALRAQTPTQELVCRAKCEVCGTKFTRKSSLTVHMRIHTGERPYACDCGATFKQNASLRAHAAAKHGLKEVSAIEVAES